MSLETLEDEEEELEGVEVGRGKRSGRGIQAELRSTLRRRTREVTMGVMTSDM